MLEKINAIRVQMTSTLAAGGFDVFAQRHINTEELADKNKVIMLGFDQSGRAGGTLADEFETTLTLAVYHEIPITDAAMEAIALQAQTLLEGDATLAAMMSGMDYTGHAYPPDQDSVFVSLETYYSVILGE